MKLFEWISQHYLRDNPLPPRKYNGVGSNSVAGAAVSTSVVGPNDSDLIVSICGQASGGGAQTVVNMDLYFYYGGQVSYVRKKFPDFSGQQKLEIWIPEFYVPRGTTMTIDGYYSAGAVANLTSLWIYGFQIPPCDIM